MTEVSPGQAAYEAFQRAFPSEDWGPWDGLDDIPPDEGEAAPRPGWEAVALAGCGEWAKILADITEQRDELRSVLAEIFASMEMTATQYPQDLQKVRLDSWRARAKLGEVPQ